MGSLFESLKSSLDASGGLSPFDERAVWAVAGLLSRVEAARLEIEAQGVVVNGRENPACLTERTALAELRGWVTARPDLFGERKDKPVHSESKLARFKAV